jgi:hypothetical protein
VAGLRAIERAEFMTASANVAQQRTDLDEMVGGTGEKPCGDQGAAQLAGSPEFAQVGVEATQQDLVGRREWLAHEVQQYRLPRDRSWFLDRHDDDPPSADAG